MLRRLGRGVYCPEELAQDAWTVINAWKRALPQDVVFAGATAAWLHGLEVDPIHPVDVIVPLSSGARTRDGLRVRHALIRSGEVTRMRGHRVTSIDRTLRDLHNRLHPVELLVAIDGAVRRRLIDPGRLTHPRRMQKLVRLAAPAESPMETRLRWLLLNAGLPRPEVQKDLRDDDDRFVGRADLYYPSARLVIEYDGINHRDRLVEDNRRQNLLINGGYRVLRFTATDVHQRPEVVTALVRQALRAGRV